jgi:hypothetical protein
MNIIIIENGKENPIAVCDNIFDVVRTLIMETEYGIEMIRRNSLWITSNYEVEIEYIEHGKEYHPLTQRYAFVHVTISYDWKSKDSKELYGRLYDSEVYYLTLYELNKHKDEDYGFGTWIQYHQSYLV